MTHETHLAAARLNGLPCGQVSEIQRARLLAAAVGTVEDVGYARMTVAQVIARARVSRKTFYDVFADREDCFLAAFEQTHSQAWRAASEACDPESGWRERVRSGLGRLLVLMEQEPGLSRLWIVEALGGGERVLERRAEALDDFAKVIHQGRFAATGELRPPELAALGVVGGVFTVLHTRVLMGPDEPLTGLLNSLMSIIVLPYLGPRAAGRELKRPPLQIPRDGRSRRPARNDDPLDGLKMRLTYRTVRVLTVIARHPGSSNRGIAEGSGVSDEGQISKLLHRLARLNLIENHGAGQERGVANAWYLTPRGERLERATRTSDLP